VPVLVPRLPHARVGLAPVRLGLVGQGHQQLAHGRVEVTELVPKLVGGGQHGPGRLEGQALQVSPGSAVTAARW
jgi:hypothetical protein